MVNWQITATTIYCECVDDEVTLMVYKELNGKCTGLEKYSSNGGNGRLLKRKSKESGRKLECKGQACCRLREYIDKLVAEEKAEEGGGGK